MGRPEYCLQHMPDKVCSIDEYTVSGVLHVDRQGFDKQDKSTRQQEIGCLLYTRCQNPCCVRLLSQAFNTNLKKSNLSLMIMRTKSLVRLTKYERDLCRIEGR